MQRRRYLVYPSSSWGNSRGSQDVEFGRYTISGVSREFMVNHETGISWYLMAFQHVFFRLWDMKPTLWYLGMDWKRAQKYPHLENTMITGKLGCHPGISTKTGRGKFLAHWNTFLVSWKTYIYKWGIFWHPSYPLGKTFTVCYWTWPTDSWFTHDSGDFPWLCKRLLEGQLNLFQSDPDRSLSNVFIPQFHQVSTTNSQVSTSYSPLRYPQVFFSQAVRPPGHVCWSKKNPDLELHNSSGWQRSPATGGTRDDWRTPHPWHVHPNQ